jgi:hypothetical protein
MHHTCGDWVRQDTAPTLVAPAKHVSDAEQVSDAEHDDDVETEPPAQNSDVPVSKNISQRKTLTTVKMCVVVFGVCGLLCGGSECVYVVSACVFVRGRVGMIENGCSELCIYVEDTGPPVAAPSTLLSETWLPVVSTEDRHMPHLYGITDPPGMSTPPPLREAVPAGPGPPLPARQAGRAWEPWALPDHFVRDLVNGPLGFDVHVGAVLST